LPGIAERRQAIEALITENEEIEARFSKWQQDDDLTDAEIQLGQRQYHDWYARAQAHVPAAEVEKFRDMYEGGRFISRIKAFLVNPLELN
jgi:hypothetical protein